MFSGVAVSADKIVARMSEKILTGSINRRLGQAMHDYAMLSEGDAVLLAVSGGIDSLVLAWILSHWRKKAPIHFTLQAVCVDPGFWQQQEGDLENPTLKLAEQLAVLNLPVMIKQAWTRPEETTSCFQCARNRRSQLFDLARQLGCNKIAFGHHKDDLIETFFLNLLYSGNISTMVPKQELFEGRLSVIRPMAYLVKDEILRIGQAAGLHAMPNYCPFAKDSRREKIKAIIGMLREQEPECEKSIFSALGNVRTEYLL